RDAVTLDDAPEAVLVGEVGRAFVHHGGGAIGEGAVHDVRMPGDPADVGGAPVDIGVLEVEHPVGGRVDAGEVAAGGVLDALGLPGGARGVQEVEHVLGVHLLRRAVGGRVLDEVRPPDVAAGLHVHGGAGALEHDHRAHVGALLESSVHVLL